MGLRSLSPTIIRALRNFPIGYFACYNGILLLLLYVLWHLLQEERVLPSRPSVWCCSGRRHHLYNDPIRMKNRPARKPLLTELSTSRTVSAEAGKRKEHVMRQWRGRVRANRSWQPLMDGEGCKTAYTYQRY